MTTNHPGHGKTVLVTGGSKGIGAATSLLYAKHGFNVAINYSSDATAANKLVEEIGATHAIAIKADAGSIPEIERMVAETVQKFGKIDVLVPCAAILPMKDLEHTSEADFDDTVRLNVKGPYFLVQKAAPHMPEGSHVVLISTSLTVASMVTPGYLLYNTTKGAIEQMTRVMSKDLARKGIVVNAVAPGPTGTELFFKGKSEELVKTIAGFSPFNRIGKPEDIAEAIVFLSGDQSRWISGQVLRANGGYT